MEGSCGEAARVVLRLITELIFQSTSSILLIMTITGRSESL